MNFVQFLKNLRPIRILAKQLRRIQISVLSQLKPRLKVFSQRPDHKKRALLCYLIDAVNMRDSDSRMRKNANWWAGRELARILDSLGYDVDVIQENSSIIPSKQYDLILDAASNLPRLAPFQTINTKYMLFLTGSYYGWSGPAEAIRIADFEKKHGVFYTPRFGEQPKILMDKALGIADSCLLVGNEITLSTYPYWCQMKTRLVHMPPQQTSSRKNWANNQHSFNSFLYFSSPRNVLKGLDLVLDVFCRHPEWILHVVGNVKSEDDFMAAYTNISSKPNILFHGTLSPDSRLFDDIIKRCQALVFPSCTEGSSTSALVVLLAGLYPILSRNSGVSLPDATGIWIETLSIEGVERAILNFVEMDHKSIVEESRVIQSYIERNYSQERFRHEVTKAILDIESRKRTGSTLEGSWDWIKEVPIRSWENPLFGDRRRPHHEGTHF